MGNLKNKKKYAPCCPIQCSIESDIENVESFGGGGVQIVLQLMNLQEMNN